MYAPKDSQLEITVQEEASSSNAATLNFAPVTETVGDLPGYPYTVTLEKLKPLTNYKYQVSVNGKSDATHGGTFQTAPIAGKASSALSMDARK
ncbi:MAG: fibronectin type III domain-containing protein [Planctomycetaceae bacterium]|nr:fibronectin type III domain-containing protein [Planctomycetaceae bacterium]